MSGLIQGKTTEENIAVKRFGYLFSALFLCASVVAMVAESACFPWLFLVTMYFLSASLWLPVLIRPLYSLFGKYLPIGGLSETDESQKVSEKDRKNR